MPSRILHAVVKLLSPGFFGCIRDQTIFFSLVIWKTAASAGGAFQLENTMSPLSSRTTPAMKCGVIPKVLNSSGVTCHTTLLS